MAHRTSPEQLAADVFRSATHYPGVAGYKAPGTSAEAAEKIEPFAQALRGRVARLMAEIYPAGATADEAAKTLGVSNLAARPRFTELLKAGLIEKTGQKRRNSESTLNANVWRATELLRSTVAAGGRGGV